MPGRADEEFYTRNLLSVASSSGRTCYLIGALVTSWEQGEGGDVLN